VLALIAAFFDLAINKALFAPESLFGQFFANVGEFPSYLAAPAVGVIMFCQRLGKSSRAQLIFKILFAALTAAGWYFFFSWVLGHLSNVDYLAAYCAVFAAIFTFLSLFICYRVPIATMKKLFWFAVFLAITAICVNVVIQILKAIWARERFRVMVGGYDRALVPNGNYDGFTPWYLPQGFAKRGEDYMGAAEAVDALMGHHGDAFKSFPSGHTGAASVLMAIIILPDIMPKTLGRFKKLFWIVPFVYIAIMGLSRIVMGAHFLSDVLFGGYIGILVAVVVRFIMIKKVKALNAEPEFRLVNEGYTVV
jgi:membrane-associated phospholipid phosphatase